MRTRFKKNFRGEKYFQQFVQRNKLIKIIKLLENVSCMYNTVNLTIYREHKILFYFFIYKSKLFETLLSFIDPITLISTIRDNSSWSTKE